jgi:4-coumarate--CoA ligase
MSPTQIYTERRGSTLEYHNRMKLDIPNLDMLTLLFGSSRSRHCNANANLKSDSKHGTAKDSTIIHADAANPSLHLTKSDSRKLTQRVAHTLRHKYGVGASNKKSYVTAISSGNYVLPSMFYGIVAAGGIFSSVSSSSTTQELARLIESAPSDLVICSRELKDLAIAAAKQCKLDSSRVLIIDEENATLRDINDKEILGRDKLPWERITSRKELEERITCLIYYSGTTGLPKGVPLSHMNIVSQVYITCSMQREKLAQQHPNFKYVTLAHLPVAHIAGMQGFMVNPFFMGGTTYWMPKFDFAQFLDYNKRYGVSIFFTVPPVYLLIAKSPAVTDQLKSMVVAYTGAAPMKKELQEAAAKKMGDGSIFITQTWGLSESTGSATLLNIGERDDTGSVSRLLPNMSARYVSRFDTKRSILTTLGSLMNKARM